MRMSKLLLCVCFLSSFAVNAQSPSVIQINNSVERVFYIADGLSNIGFVGQQFTHEFDGGAYTGISFDFSWVESEKRISVEEQYPEDKIRLHNCFGQSEDLSPSMQKYKCPQLIRTTILPRLSSEKASIFTPVIESDRQLLLKDVKKSKIGDWQYLGQLEKFHYTRDALDADYGAIKQPYTYWKSINRLPILLAECSAYTDKKWHEYNECWIHKITIPKYPDLILEINFSMDVLKDSSKIVDAAIFEIENGLLKFSAPPKK